MKTRYKIFFMLTVLLALSGCADAVDPSQIAEMEPVGFFYGLWHGWIAVIAFFVSLFSDSTAVYAVYNSGGWYDFGFLIGVGAFCTGCSNA